MPLLPQQSQIVKKEHVKPGVRFQANLIQLSWLHRSHIFTADLFYGAQGTSRTNTVGDFGGSCVCSGVRKAGEEDDAPIWFSKSSKLM